MNEDGVDLLLNQILGELAYASAVAEIAFHLASASMSPKHVSELLDGVILAFERNQALVSQSTKAVEHARSRLETLRSFVDAREPL